ncbi:MAG TPA: right-handed parallel beta-helix repeat-containing protein, partial [Bacteroidales bacterium]
MKTKTLQMTSGLLMVIFWLATITLNAQITFKGYYADHEGGIGWDADGTGTEPAGDGHNNQYYYCASPDYDNFDPDPQAALGHFMDCPEGFPQFMAALEEHNVDISGVKLRYTLSSLGNDEEGIDWLAIGSDEYINYYGSTLKIYVQNQLMISMQMPYLNFKWQGSGSNWYIETPFMIPKDASLWSNDVTKELAAAFIRDMDGQSLQLTCNSSYSGYSFIENGRDGAWYNVFNGLLTKGTPEIPFKGLNADHEGFAGWDADGTGPEPAGDGHGTQLYYGASLDYSGLDADPDAALGHFLEGANGFRNLLTQLEYRGYSINDLKLKMGLISLANDEQGIDWGNGWCNYYNQVLTLALNDENILHFMSDTLHLLSYSSYWTSESSFSPVRNISENTSEDAQIIAQAFLLDIGMHQISMPTTDIRVGTTFSGNGRNGAYFQVYEAKVIGMCGMVNCIEEGNLAGNLKAENSPYLINGNIEVPLGQTLEIEPGTRIAFRGPYRMNVKGNIIAEGTAEEPITFTHSNPNVLWDGFDYDSTASSSDTSFFKHCVFEHGYGFGEGASNSGGIFALAYFDKLVVENSVFRYNRVNKAGTYPASGGAVALWESSPMFVNCTFHNNQAKYGGAIMVYNNSNPVISNCLFYENIAEFDGGAIEVYTNSDAILINNTFADNFAGRYGGAIDFYDNSNPIISNSLFYENIAEQDGGAIEVYTNSEAILINNTFADNFAGRYGGAIDVFDNSNPNIINTIMWGNRATVEGNEVNITEFSQPNFYYCNVQGGPDEFGGATFTGEFFESLDEDPMFENNEEFPLYYPNYDSPILNAGTPDDSEWYLEEYLPNVDLWNYPRNAFGRIDMGVYEHTAVNVPEPGTSANTSLTAYPNPFHHSTNIEFSLEKTTWVQIDVYNVIGEKVDVIYQAD